MMRRSQIEIRSGSRLAFDGCLSGPCPFRAGPFLGQAAVAKAAFYAALGTVSMGNREGPARTARRRVEVRQNWARQSAELEGSAPSFAFAPWSPSQDGGAGFSYPNPPFNGLCRFHDFGIADPHKTQIVRPSVAQAAE